MRRRRCPECASGPDRVILIEHSSGVQVGSGNDQVSVYRVTIPRVSLASADSVARALLSPGAPWSGNIFSHDARPDLSRAAGSGPGSSSGGIIEGSHGDTLVLVRNSRGVQVGKGNVQHNDFRVTVSDVAVRPAGTGMTSLGRLVSRLRENPGDEDAARQMADGIGQAARTDLEADVTFEVRRAVGDAQIPSQSGKFSGLTGRQVVGPGNHATTQVRVTVGKVDTAALERSLKEIAARLPRAPGSGRPGSGAWDNDGVRAPTLTTPSRAGPSELDSGGDPPRTLAPGRPGSGQLDRSGDASRTNDADMWPWIPGPFSRPGRPEPGGR